MRPWLTVQHRGAVPAKERVKKLAELLAHRPQRGRRRGGGNGCSCAVSSACRLAVLLFPFLALTAASAEPPADAGVRCEIQAVTERGMVTLHGLIFARTPAAGRYQLRATKSGNGNLSNVSQSGEFRAGPDAPAVAGTLKLGGPGETDATLEVFWDGRSVTCRLREGESL